ncbi:MAG: carboxypeptidase-like regulatory domain-containing protein [Bacteroidota bacterium]
MKTSVFFILCAAWLFASLPQFTQAQTLRQTACGTLEVDAETTPADRAYVGGLFTPHCFPNETVLINGARVPAFSYTLFRLPPGGGQVAVTNRQTDASRTSFSNLAPGRYYVRVSATTYLSRRAVNTECNPVGFQAASSPNITSTNNAIVGDPVPQISLEDSYCCGEDVILNTNGTEGNNEYMITICQKANPNDAGCINWNGTGWIVGAVPTELNLLEVWNINQGWPFWPGYYYEVMLAVQNNCSSWEATRETFFVNAPETQFTIRNDNGAVVQDGGTICASAMPPVMDPSGSSCGSKYIVIISNIEDGSLVIFTDGRHNATPNITLNDAMNSLSGKKRYIAALSSGDLDEDALRTLAQSDNNYYQAEDVASIEQMFLSIQEEISSLSNSVYYMFYQSPITDPTPFENELRIEIFDNANTGNDGQLIETFNSAGFGQ